MRLFLVTTKTTPAKTTTTTLSTMLRNSLDLELLAIRSVAQPGAPESSGNDDSNIFAVTKAATTALSATTIVAIVQLDPSCDGSSLTGLHSHQCCCWSCRCCCDDSRSQCTNCIILGKRGRDTKRPFQRLSVCTIFTVTTGTLTTNSTTRRRANCCAHFVEQTARAS